MEGEKRVEKSSFRKTQGKGEAFNWRAELTNGCILHVEGADGQGQYNGDILGRRGGISGWEKEFRRTEAAPPPFRKENGKEIKKERKTNPVPGRLGVRGQTIRI